MNDYSTEISNILIIGSGGAGLRAGIEAKFNGLKVHILSKRSKNDAHTVLAAGGINASFGNLDKKDCWQQHFVDTYEEGYGIGNPKIIEIMAKESPKMVEEIDFWGANFAKLKNGKLDQRFFGAHTYRRTCYSGDYTGQSILKALLKKCKELSIPIFDQQYVTDLLVEDNICFGAMSFNTKTGERTAHLADATIICTGGHTNSWKRSSSRKQENTGDGLYLALKAGCSLIDMEMVQFHPTGMIKPDDMAGTLVTEAVRGEGGRLLNSKGERFMKTYDKERMELSTRDRVALANYTEIVEGRASKNGGVYLDISFMDKEFIIKKIPKIYRQFIESQMLDISKSPMEVAPTSHYSMGGIEVCAEKHSTEIEGLFAAGEVTGGLHGANRLGGNSLAEILVFGKQAGVNASNYSKNLSSVKRSKNVIKLCHQNIDQNIINGNELSIPLLNELSNIMWTYCGVVKSEENLKKGLEKILKLKSLLNEIEVIIEDNNYQDLINKFDLKASIITSEATIISAIARKESRGSHQRSDYKKIRQEFNKNFLVRHYEDELHLYEKNLKEPNHELKAALKDYKFNSDEKGKLLE